MNYSGKRLVRNLVLIRSKKYTFVMTHQCLDTLRCICKKSEFLFAECGCLFS